MLRLLALLLLLLGVLLGVLLLWMPGSPAAEGGRVEVDGPQVVHGLLAEDADGDGVGDLLLLEGRSVRGFRGRQGALPAPKPTWVVELAPDVSFVDVAPPARGASPPALLVLGTQGLRRVSLEDGRETAVDDASAALAWRDFRQASFADLASPDGTRFLPTSRGWRVVPPAGSGRDPIEVAVPLLRWVEAPGHFLEDLAVVTHAHPRIVLGGAPGGASARTASSLLWVWGGTALSATYEGQEIHHDLAFLPADGDWQRLVDLDGDRVPDVVQSQGTNREGSYAFYRTPRPHLLEGVLRPGEGVLRPPISVLRFSGYRLTQACVDLDGDGLRDFVVTTIPVDARNTMRALGGKVTANTRAFLHRKEASGYFGTTPDASILSDVGVLVRFSQAGNLDVRRSFTILVDGDYDGDGRLDLAIRTASDAITLRRGVPEGVWEAKGRSVPIPPMGASPDLEGHAADLTGDGQDELILLYRSPYGGRDRVWVVRP